MSVHVSTLDCLPFKYRSWLRQYNYVISWTHFSSSVFSVRMFYLPIQLPFCFLPISSLCVDLSVRFLGKKSSMIFCSFEDYILLCYDEIKMSKVFVFFYLRILNLSKQNIKYSIKYLPQIVFYFKFKTFHFKFIWQSKDKITELYLLYSDW